MSRSVLHRCSETHVDKGRLLSVVCCFDFLKNNFIFFILARWVCCCGGFFLVAVSWGYSLVVVLGLLFSRVCLIAQSWLNLEAPCTVACQAPLSMGFSRQEYWGELPFLTQESNSRFLHCRPSELRGKLSFHSGVFLVELGSRAPLLPGSRALA